MLETFTAATFDIGDTLTLDLGEDRHLDISLVKASPRGQKMPWARREPFVLIFRGPRDVSLPQGLYRMRHGKIGTFEMVLAPVMPPYYDADSLFYQASFC